MYRYAKAECCWILLGIVFLVIGELCNLYLPIVIGKALDAINSSNWDDVYVIVGHFGIVIGIQAVSISLRAFIFNSISERIARNLRRDYYESMLRKDVAFFDDKKTGDLLTRLNSDIQIV